MIFWKMDDALVAKLLGMGFEFEQIQNCCDALSSVSTGLNLQKATEWLLDKSRQQDTPSNNTLVLTPPIDHTHSGDAVTHIHKPLSSSSDLAAQSPSEPLTSRYNLGTAHMKDKERFAVMEREEAVKKARERRREDIIAKEHLRKQIQAEKKARTSKTTPLSTTPTSDTPAPSDNATPTASTEAPVSVSSTCRMQLRLPNGRVLRNVFPSSAMLDEVMEYVRSSDAEYSTTTLTLAQPFPRHEYTPAEGQRSLGSLRLCPSASLVVSQQGTGKRGVASATPLAPRAVVDPMDVDDDKGEDDSGSDSDSSMEHEYIPVPVGRRGRGRGRGRGRDLIPPPIGRQGLVPPIGGLGPQRGHMINQTFGGHGYRLGGRDVPMATGDQPESAVLAGGHHHGNQPSSSSIPVSHTHSIPSLEGLCTRVLVSHSSQYGMPSCASISPLMGQKLMAALKLAKKLNSKTMMSFYKCPVTVINLDNYLYATNELLANICHFPLLRELSLCCCPIITDRAMTEMLPYLPGLTCLRLNGCSQLSQAMFRALRGCKGLEVLELAHVKLSDEGLRLLLYYSLEQLKELDLSYTQVTVAGLRLLPTGAPLLEKLSLENTQANNFSPLTQMTHLHSLNLSRCPASSMEALGALGQCHGLKTLVLSGVVMEGEVLEVLAGLELENLKLPDRNLFFDNAMETVAGFPLLALDLSDYLHVTDVGISSLTAMTSLTSLSLSRTKLTDVGMAFLEGLSELNELCLDNTLVTDVGLSHVAGLVRLEVLSLADTKVTSQFITNGVLVKLNLLSKLNLSRTAVCDRGLLSLALPSLTMLNLDWTCVTLATTLSALSTGCPVLETLRNRNICQPLPRSARSLPGDDEGENMV